MTCEDLEGSLNRAKQGLWAQENIEEIGFFSQHETQEMNVLPRRLMEVVWDDWREGFPTIKFLGTIGEELGNDRYYR